MNKNIKNRIIFDKKITLVVYIYIMIIVIISLSLIIVFMLFHYKIYYHTTGTIIKEEDTYYLKCYVPLENMKYITENSILKINKKNYKYEVITIEDEYYSDNNVTYQIVKIKTNIDSKYSYNNLVLELKFLKEDKRVLDYIINYWRS